MNLSISQIDICFKDPHLLVGTSIHVYCVFFNLSWAFFYILDLNKTRQFQILESDIPGCHCNGG